MHLSNIQTYCDEINRVAALDLPWSKLAGATIVLSGASGMIGSFLVDVLMARNTNHALDATVVALARNRDTMAARFSSHAGDNHLVLASADVTTGPLDLAFGDYVIHAASNTHPVSYAQDPIGTITTNIQGTYNMLDLAKRVAARRAVFVSTVEIYGQNRVGGEPFKESDLGYIDCNTLRAGYPESKRAGEALCQAFLAHDGVDVVIPRLPRVFGPTMRLDDSKAASQFLLRGAAGQDIVLKSAGHQLYSYCHVADAVGAILTSLLVGQTGQAYNVADPSGAITLKDLANLVAAAAGVKVVFDLPDDVESRGFSTATLAVMDGSKLAQLGWMPLYDLADGVAATIGVLRALG